MRPVTHDAEVAVKRQSKNGVAVPSAEDTGSISKNVPTAIRTKKEKNISWKEVRWNLFPREPVIISIF
jgi:hypothetical protein